MLCITFLYPIKTAIVHTWIHNNKDIHRILQSEHLAPTVLENTEKYKC